MIITNIGNLQHYISFKYKIPNEKLLRLIAQYETIGRKITIISRYWFGN